MKCCAINKKGRPCPHNADRVRKNLWYCHVHDPEGTYAKQQRGQIDKPSRKSKRAKSAELNRKIAYENWKSSEKTNESFKLAKTGRFNYHEYLKWREWKMAQLEKEAQERIDADSP